MIVRWTILGAFLGGTPESEFDGDGRVLSLSLGGMDIFIALQDAPWPSRKGRHYSQALPAYRGKYNITFFFPSPS